MKATDLFDDFAARYARGERPDARDYLERAGKDADELAGLIDAYLRVAPAREPDAETVAVMEAVVAGEPPLLHLRVERKLTRDAVVAALMSGLGLDAKEEPKVRRYYHELETGLLDPERVDRRVFSVLGKALGARVADLLASRPPAFAADAVYLRASEAAEAPTTPRPEPSGEPDDVDRLFNTPSTSAQ